MAKVTKRSASHAGSWYTSNPVTLSQQLDGWLHNVPNVANGVNLPVQGGRIIIAPHAGYSYSGPAAAWAYKALDVSKAKRIFLLGPSHHFYLTTCALSKFACYSTPLGDLQLDQEILEQLYSTQRFEVMKSSTDEDEHSLEMHLPYIYKVLSQHFSEGNFPTLVPILVGNTSPETEAEFGSLLAPYLADKNNVFVVSSDFAHWGLRFSYTAYLPSLSSADNIRSLQHSDKKPESPKIYESIAAIDKMTMSAIETGSHADFLRSLRKTGNTVCGRHPIGIVMAAIEALEAEEQVPSGLGRFKWLRYERSSDCVKVADNSVSYVSGIAILDDAKE